MIYARLQSVLFWECRPKKCLRLVSRRLLVLVVLYEGQHLTHIYYHCVLVTNVLLQRSTILSLMWFLALCPAYTEILGPHTNRALVLVDFLIF